MAKQNGIVLNLSGNKPAKIPLKDQVIEQGISFDPNNNTLGIKFPKISVINLEEDSVEALSCLVAHDVPGGNTQADIIVRTFARTPEGFSFKVSEEERARTITIPADEAVDFMSFLRDCFTAGRSAVKEAEKAEK
jgi:hypothetical protein